ncbi:MAG TPA: TlpA disulfide reductase family protein [Longimicrobiales bacterium]
MRACLTALATGLLLVAATVPLRAQDVGLPIGAIPDAVQLEDLDGNAVDLRAIIAGRPALIEFWATWCPLCAALEPHITAAKREHGDALEVVIVAVGVNQTPRSIRRHIARHAPPGRVLFDARGRATRAFMAPTTSYIVALDAQGRVVYTGVGEDQDIAAAARKALRR